VCSTLIKTPAKQSRTDDLDARIYPCLRCGAMLSKAEGGLAFSMCDACSHDGNGKVMKTDSHVEIEPTSEDVASIAVLWYNPDCVFIEQVEVAEHPKDGYKHLVALNQAEALQVLRAMQKFADLKKPIDWFERIRLSLGGALLGVVAANVLTELMFYPTTQLALSETVGGLVGFVVACVWLSRTPS
jgi:hypothetical protein